MPSLTSNPSIWTKSWFSVCSRSSLVFPRPAPRCLPTASISSIKIKHGLFFFAVSNKSLTRAAPTPTNISTKSLPVMLKNGTPASPAIAFPRRVFPVPGGPTIKTPFGILAPRSVNFLGFFKNSTSSLISFFSSSHPATSLNLTFKFCSILALFFPKSMFCPLIFLNDLKIRKKNRTNKII